MAERLPMRELVRLARERLGAKASRLKTREELEAALELAPAPPALPPVAADSSELSNAAPPDPLVTADYFKPSG